MIGFAIVGIIPTYRLRRTMNDMVFKHTFRMITRSISGLVRFHNPEYKPKNCGFCVANHTTPIDIAILSTDCIYSLVRYRWSKRASSCCLMERGCLCPGLVWPSFLVTASSFHVSCTLKCVCVWNICIYSLNVRFIGNGKLNVTYYSRTSVSYLSRFCFCSNVELVVNEYSCEILNCKGIRGFLVHYWKVCSIEREIIVEIGNRSKCLATRHFVY